ncbi:MAG: hypothetical protein IT372_34160 [Polyangiaceae bacterium]|nr:hypothetical protein [Polyangiaceae bacterium]
MLAPYARRLAILALILPSCGGDEAVSPQQPQQGAPAEVCADALDNDGDGLPDCADPDCYLEAACGEAAVEVDCGDGVDDDGDGISDCADPDCAGDPACLPEFALEAHTLMTPEGALALATNLPALVGACQMVEAKDVPCADVDEDGLADAWEDLVLTRIQPLSRYDEDEPLVTDAAAVTVNVGRVALIAAEPLEVNVYVMLGYSRDYGSCGLTSHNGDSERVALKLLRHGDAPGDVVMAAAYTAAHEGTATDHGRVFSTAELPGLTFTPDPATGEPRWMVFPSAAKHATYATVEICEGISPVPCFDEDCAPDGVADPALYDRLPVVHNAGEELHPRLTDLGPIGFPGDDAWADQDFCGGLGSGDACSSPVREKLLDDPFTGSM